MEFTKICDAKDTLVEKLSALNDTKFSGDPVVDHPGCTLNEFLNNEMAK